MSRPFSAINFSYIVSLFFFSLISPIAEVKPAARPRAAPSTSEGERVSKPSDGYYKQRKSARKRGYGAIYECGEAITDKRLLRSGTQAPNYHYENYPKVR